MSKDEISAKIRELAGQLAELTCEVMALENCAACKLTVEMTNVMGVVQVSQNIQTSQPGDIETLQAAAKKFMEEKGIPKEEAAPARPASEQVDEVLAQLRKNRNNN